MTDVNQNEVQAQAVKVADDAFEMVEALTIDSTAMYELAGNELRAIVTKRKQIEEARMSLTRPIDAAKKKVMEFFAVPLARIDLAESNLRRNMGAFKAKQDRLADLARREAEEKARIERERIEAERREAEAKLQEAKSSGDADAIEQANEALLDAQDAAEIAEFAPVVAMPVARATAKGISTTKRWKALDVDLKTLVIAAGRAAENGDASLLGYLCADMTAINGVVRSLKANTNIPGVRAGFEESISARRVG